MSYFIVEMHSDLVTAHEAEILLKQLIPVKSYNEITETDYVKFMK